MSDYAAPQTQDQPTDPGSASMTPPMARYTFHIPSKGKDGRELPHVLGALRTALTQAGYAGRLVIRKAQGDWNHHDTHDVDLVMVDAPDDPTHLQAMLQFAQGAKAMSGHDALYLTKQPVESYVV